MADSFFTTEDSMMISRPTPSTATPLSIRTDKSSKLNTPNPQTTPLPYIRLLMNLLLLLKYVCSAWKSEEVSIFPE